MTAAFYGRSKSFLGARRVTLLSVLFFILAFLLILKLFYLQVWRHDYYNNLATKRYTTTEKIMPARGRIFTDAFKPNAAGESRYALATNQKFYLLYSEPALIAEATATVEKIDQVITLTTEEKKQMAEKMNKKDPYEPLKHFISLNQKDELLKKKIIGLGFQEEEKRIYPQNNSFSQVLGFLGYKKNERVGQYGLEEYFNDFLAGQGGIVTTEKDPRGRLISWQENNSLTIIDGGDLILTLEPTVQWQACNILAAWVKKMAAADGTAIVVEPTTGQIIALCNKPDFDPNNYSQVDNIAVYNNQAVSEAYEPGSVFKTITMATALEAGQVTPETKYNDIGEIRFGPDIIHNAKNKKYGLVNMTQVLENSINTGIIFAALKTGHDVFKEFVEKFGFGKKTNIDLPQESSGNISSLENKKDIYLATAAYGQGISVTPLQLIMSYAAIVNDGILMQPQIIKEKIFASGRQEFFSPQQVRRVISSETANIIKAMLVSVVKNGHAKGAAVPGYYVGGKTGTANISAPGGGYSEETIHTFVGFAPLEKPRFVALIKISKPKNSIFAEGSVVPAFAELAKFLLNYYQVPPEY